jgi:hypothetical protein
VTLRPTLSHGLPFADYYDVAIFFSCPLLASLDQVFLRASMALIIKLQKNKAAAADSVELRILYRQRGVWFI